MASARPAAGPSTSKNDRLNVYSDNDKVSRFTRSVSSVLNFLTDTGFVYNQNASSCAVSVSYSKKKSHLESVLSYMHGVSIQYRRFILLWWFSNYPSYAHCSLPGSSVLSIQKLKDIMSDEGEDWIHLIQVINSG